MTISTFHGPPSGRMEAESLFGDSNRCYHWMLSQHRAGRNMEKIKPHYYLFDGSHKVVLDPRRQKWLWKQAERRNEQTSRNRKYQQRKRADGLTDVQCHYLGIKGEAAVLLAYGWPKEPLKTLKAGGVGIMGDAITPSGKTVQIKLPQGRNRQFALPTHRQHLETDYGILVWPDEFTTPVDPSEANETLQVIGWCSKEQFQADSDIRTFSNGSQHFLPWKLMQAARDFPSDDSQNSQ